MLTAAAIIDQELIDSLDKLRINIAWFPVQIIHTTFDNSTEFITYVTKTILDIRNTAIKDLSSSNLTIEQRTLYLGLLMSFVVKDRLPNLEDMLKQALEIQKKWQGFLFYDLFFLLIQELNEMIKSDMVNTKEIWYKYHEIREQYLLERDGKIDDFLKIKAKMFEGIQEYLDNYKPEEE